MPRYDQLSLAIQECEKRNIKYRIEPTNHHLKFIIQIGNKEKFVLTGRKSGCKTDMRCALNIRTDVKRVINELSGHG